MVAHTAFRSEAQFTQAEFRRWLAARPPSEANHYELIDGRIVMTPPAGWPHGRIGATLTRALDEHVRRAKLGIVLDSSTCYELPSGDSVEPDVSFIAADRWAAGPRPREGQFLRIVPSLVIEILSTATARHDRTEKKKIYERNAVNEYWIVEPRARTLTVFHLSRRSYTAGRTFKSGLVKSRALPRLELAVEEVFES